MGAFIGSYLKTTFLIETYYAYNGFYTENYSFEFYQTSKMTNSCLGWMHTTIQIRTIQILINYALCL